MDLTEDRGSQMQEGRQASETTSRAGACENNAVAERSCSVIKMSDSMRNQELITWVPRQGNETQGVLAALGVRLSCSESCFSCRMRQPASHPVLLSPWCMTYTCFLYFLTSPFHKPSLHKVIR